MQDDHNRDRDNTDRRSLQPHRSSPVLRIAAVFLAAFVAGSLGFGYIFVSTVGDTLRYGQAGSGAAPTESPPSEGTLLDRAVTPPPAPRTAGQPISTAPAPGPAAAPASRYVLLYVAGGDVWETDGERSTRMTQDGSVMQPAFTGDLLVYVERAKNRSDLWLAEEGRSPRQLTQNASPIIDWNRWIFQPVPVPGDLRLYVISDYDKAGAGPGSMAIWRLNLRDMSYRQITYPQSYTGGDQDTAVNPQKPEQIVFTRYSYLSSGQLAEQLFWQDTSQRGAIALTSTEEHARQAAFSPDGARLAFVQAAGAGENLFVGRLDIADGKPQLAEVQQVAEGMIAQPVWSPDGTSLAVQLKSPSLMVSRLSWMKSSTSLVLRHTSSTRTCFVFSTMKSQFME